MLLLLGIAAVCFLAFSNGANDNFKGVATLLGSKTSSYKTALIWAAITTFAGSLLAFYLSQKLMSNFSGKGLVPNEITNLPSFAVAIALAAAITVFLATKFGFPISTTHAITGALVGSGFIASSAGVNLDKLITSFFIPLALSPLLALFLAIILYPLLKLLRIKLNIKRDACLCIGNEVIACAPGNLRPGIVSQAVLKMESLPTMSFGTQISCEERYVGQVFGVSAKKILDILHFMSAGLMSFARGLNDTPKIAAIMLVGASFSPKLAIIITAIIMCLGGILYIKKIANTMSYQITEMNDGQGFTANFITSLIVIGASKFGLPVSTTHVSCGSLFGIGAVTKQAHWKMIFKIILAWVITLPISGLLGILFFSLLRRF